MKEEIYVAEYNFKQQAPHLQTVKARNQRTLGSNRDWIVIYIGTYEECNKALEELRTSLDF